MTGYACDRQQPLIASREDAFPVSSPTARPQPTLSSHRPPVASATLRDYSSRRPRGSSRTTVPGSPRALKRRHGPAQRGGRVVGGPRSAPHSGPRRRRRRRRQQQRRGKSRGCAPGSAVTKASHPQPLRYRPLAAPPLSVPAGGGSARPSLRPGVLPQGSAHLASSCQGSPVAAPGSPQPLPEWAAAGRRDLALRYLWTVTVLFSAIWKYPECPVCGFRLVSCSSVCLWLKFCSDVCDFHFTANVVSWFRIRNDSWDDRLFSLADLCAVGVKQRNIPMCVYLQMHVSLRWQEGSQLFFFLQKAAFFLSLQKATYMNLVLRSYRCWEVFSGCSVEQVLACLERHWSQLYMFKKYCGYTTWYSFWGSAVLVAC